MFLDNGSSIRMLFNVSHAVLFWFENSWETERLASMPLPGLLRRGTCKFHATLPGFVCTSRRIWAQGAGHFLHPDRFISLPFVCLFYSSVDPHTETWNKHIRSIKIIPWQRCTKAIYKDPFRVAWCRCIWFACDYKGNALLKTKQLMNVLKAK